VTASLVLGPVLDVLAPADVAAAGRRVRNGAVFLAIAAWLMPAYPPLGTDTVVHRTVICAAFAAAAVAAQFRHRYRWARVALPVAACAAAAAVAWCGSGALWGGGFIVYAVLVLAATELARPRIRLETPAEEADPLPPRPRLVARAMVWYAWFGISALVVTQWVMQFMFVPTGSMQPTIMGARPPRWGDVLLVDKTPYLRRDPHRWEIVVFQFPLFPERNFVKRVVGLPGEHLEIKDGDIWIDGKIARKPPLVQETMWQEVFPRAGLGATPSKITAFVQDVGSGGDWTRVSDTSVSCRPGARGPSLLSFNARESKFGSQVAADMRVAFTAVPDGYAVVLARVTSRGVPVTLSLDAAGPSAGSYFEVGGARTELPDVRPEGGVAVRVDLCVADGEAWALVDGREVARAEVPAGAHGKNRVEIGAASKPASFRDVYVARDIEYAPGNGSAWDIPADGFFFLGDNVAGSDDSRRWTALVFHPPGGAPAVTAAASVPDEFGQPRNQIRIDGDLQRFVDVDGVPRAVPRAGTTVETIAYPFARRSHIVGRAVMIVFPWTVAEAGFRPRFLP
jgi:signal peptidase I